MRTTILNVRTDPKVKREAAKVAESLGFTLSSLVNAYLRSLVKTKTIEFSESYEPTPYLARILKKADKDLKDDKGSPVFDNAKDAIAWLHRKR
ncbi:MAG TPA: type II toxin-antitoxin system RelB/DinJ family antitoxin [Patescibacteria group bacterium]|nr:type II toxin-antitoxin system RelB/DinJ family antitoxin [Patescibacteria group bacterium]